MTKTIFISLPVTDHRASTAFYEALGFEQNAQFSDDTAACMAWSQSIQVMLRPRRPPVGRVLDGSSGVAREPVR